MSSLGPCPSNDPTRGTDGQQRCCTHQIESLQRLPGSFNGGWSFFRSLKELEWSTALLHRAWDNVSSLITAVTRAGHTVRFATTPIAFRFRFTCRIRFSCSLGSRAGVGSRRTVIGAVVDGAFNCLLHLLDGWNLSRVTHRGNLVELYLWRFDGVLHHKSLGRVTCRCVGSRRTVIGAVVDGAFNCLLHLLDCWNLSRVPQLGPTG